MFGIVTFYLVAVMASTPASAESCLDTGLCFKCKWIGGTSRCIEWGGEGGYCFCEIVGTGQGCILQSYCSLPPLAEESKARSKRGESRVSCVPLEIGVTPRVERDWSRVEASGSLDSTSSGAAIL